LLIAPRVLLLCDLSLFCSILLLMLMLLLMIKNDDDAAADNDDDGCCGLEQVGSLLTEQGAALGGYFLASASDLEAAFALAADVTAAGQNRKGEKGKKGKTGGWIDCFAFIALFHAVLAGRVRGLGDRKGGLDKARRATLRAAVSHTARKIEVQTLHSHAPKRTPLCCTNESV
jgi:hypothetical protein